MKKGSFGKLGSDLEYDTIQTEHNFGSERRFLDYVQRMGYDRNDAHKWWAKENAPPIDATKREMYNQRSKLSQPVFSNRRGGWQFDTIIPSRKDAKNGQQYQLFFVNNNTKEIKSYPLSNKNSSSVFGALKRFFNDVERGGDKVSALTSDMDKAYTTDDILNYLASKGVDYRTTLRENHHTLGVLNRAVHSIRHKGWVYNQKHKDDHYFKDTNWQKLIKGYNDEKHGTTGMSPNEMKEDKNKELDYIAKKMNESDERRELAMKGIEPGEYVRVFEDPNFDKKEKNKKNLEPYTYRIQEVDGGHVWLHGKDENSFRRVPRYLILTDPSKVQPSNLSPESQPSGDVREVSDYKHIDGSYLVHFTDGTSRRMTWRQLREGAPLTETPAEKRYWATVNEVKKEGIQTRKRTNIKPNIPTVHNTQDSKGQLKIWDTYDKLKEEGEI